MSGHHAVEYIALSDEVRDKGIHRLIVNVLGSADLLGPSLTHDDDLVGHGQGLLLVVGDIDEGDPQLVVHILELKLHLLAHLQVKSAQGFIKKEDLRLVHQSPGDRDPLLLPARKGLNAAPLESLQIHQLQDVLYLAVDHVPRHLFLPEPEGNIVINAHMRKQGIALEHRIDRPFIRRKIHDRFSVQQDIAMRRHIKSRDHAQRCRLAASGRPQKSDEFSALYLQIEIINRLETVVLKNLADPLQFNDDIVFLIAHSFSSLPNDPGVLDPVTVLT